MKPSSRIRLRPALLLAAFLLVPASAALAADEWWDAAWQARRKVVVPKGQKWDGSGIAWISFPAATAIQKDGSDIRVATPAKIEMDCKVLSAAPGRTCEVLFRLQKVERTYYVYYGNPAAKPVESRLVPDRGLVLTTGPRLRGDCSSWEDMRLMLESSESVHGSSPVANVFMGYNPFGPSMFFWSAFRGFINVPSNGTYTFATASSDSSFLFIDGKHVVSWPGRHPAQEGLWGERNGTIDLEAGMHKFEYVHEFTRGRPAAVLGWIPPGEKQVALVPAEAFPGFQKGNPQPVELRDGGTAADFAFQALGACEGFGARFYAVRFRNGSTAGHGQKPKYVKWDFGDGVTSSEEGPIHVFMHEGKYLVRLAVAADEAGPKASACMTVDTEIEVFPAQWETLGQMYSVLKGYDLKQIQTADLRILIQVADSEGIKPDLVPLLREILQRKSEIDKNSTCQAALKLGMILVQDTDEYEAASAAFAAALENSADPRTAAAANLGSAWSGYLASKDGPQALAKLASIAGALGDGDAKLKRTALILRGDVLLDVADLKAASEAYAQADALRSPRPAKEEEIVKKGGWAYKVENLLFKEEFYKALEEVRGWEEEFPMEKIEGFSTSLKLRCLFGLKRYRDVSHEGQAFLALGVRGHFTPAVAYLTGQGLFADGDLDKALEVFDGLVSSYPESPEKTKAARMAEKIRILIAKKGE